MSQRLRWMDVLRGSAILLVMLSHSTRLLADAVPGAALVGWLDDFFEPYRMPTLMFLSGMLLPVALRKPLGTYYLGKVRRLLWPYVVWVLILAAVGGAPGPLTEPRTWYATSYLWYIFFLLCYFAVAPLVRLVPWYVVLAVAVALVVVSTPMDPAVDARTKQLLYLGAFFILGHLVAGSSGMVRALTAPPRAAAVALVLAGLVPGVVAVTTDLPAAEGAFALLSLLGVAAAVVLAASAVRAGGTRFVEWVGRNSIVFYAVHFPFLLLMVPLVEATGRSYPGVTGAALVAAAFAVALAVGCAFTWLRERTVVAWLFEWPRRRTGVPRPAPAVVASHGSPAGSPGGTVPARQSRG
jgi:fucose 4-O-acetylase-like acetyltransferase